MHDYAQRGKRRGRGEGRKKKKRRRRKSRSLGVVAIVKQSFHPSVRGETIIGEGERGEKESLLSMTKKIGR